MKKSFCRNCIEVMLLPSYSDKTSAGRASHGTTMVTEVKLHYFRGNGSTTAVVVKFFSSITE